MTESFRSPLQVILHQTSGQEPPKIKNTNPTSEPDAYSASSANIVITYSLICTYFALIFPGLLIYAFYLFSALFAYFQLIRIFLLISKLS